jgi:hypothetical protein
MASLGACLHNPVHSDYIAEKSNGNKREGSEWSGHRSWEKQKQAEKGVKESRYPKDNIKEIR